MNRLITWLLVIAVLGVAGYGGYVFFIERLFGQDTALAMIAAMPYYLAAAFVGTVAIYIRRRMG